MILYRYDRDSCDNFCGSYSTKIRLSNFNVIRETDKSYYINDNNLKIRRVSKSGKKRYAYPTKEEALLNFKTRTERCVLISKINMKMAESYLETANDEKI